MPPGGIGCIWSTSPVWGRTREKDTGAQSHTLCGVESPRGPSGARPCAHSASGLLIFELKYRLFGAVLFFCHNFVVTWFERFELIWAKACAVKLSNDISECGKSAANLTVSSFVHGDNPVLSTFVDPLEA